MSYVLYILRFGCTIKQVKFKEHVTITVSYILNAVVFDSISD